MTGSTGTFDGSYVSYWKDRVVTPTDGSKVADLEILDFFLARLGITPGERVLDLGCGFGRLFPVLSRYTPHVIGMDLSSAMLEEAAQFPYLCLVQGRMEETRLAGGSVDHIVTWATFDVVEQEQGLIEANRVLKPGGRLLLTGKNLSYRQDDQLAFVAERNAKLKDFPNHFTDVSLLLSGASSDFGFEITDAFGFSRRGDLGEHRYLEGAGVDFGACYEYLLILRKTGLPAPHPPQIAHEFSATARARAAANGFGAELLSFLAWDKERHGD